jgi:hypothetical protein
MAGNPNWKKGVSGNPNGVGKKPKLIRDAIMQEILAAGEDHKMLRKIAKRALELAADGNDQARQWVSDRLEGKVAQGIVGGDDSDAIAVHHTIIRRIIEPKS